MAAARRRSRGESPDLVHSPKRWTAIAWKPGWCQLADVAARSSRTIATRPAKPDVSHAVGAEIVHGSPSRVAASSATEFPSPSRSTQTRNVAHGLAVQALRAGQQVRDRRGRARRTCRCPTRPAAMNTGTASTGRCAMVDAAGPRPARQAPGCSPPRRHPRWRSARWRFRPWRGLLSGVAWPGEVGSATSRPGRDARYTSGPRPDLRSW